MRANRYVSYLAAEVEPKSQATLNQFEAAIERTFARIERFSGAGMAALGGTDPRAVARSRALETQLRRTRTEISATGTASRRTAAEASLMANAFTRSAIALQVVQGPLGPLAGRLGALGAAMRSLTGFALTGVLAGGGAFAIGSIATQYQTITDRLRPMFGRQQDFNGALRNVIQIAGNTRQALGPIADLYANITQSARDAGIAQSRIPGIVETVAKAARLSGGSTQSQSAAIVQFNQAFGAGFRGSGQELQSIREQAPRLGRAIAEGLGVTTAELRQLAQDGRLSADLVAKALERSSLQIETEFSRIPRRMGQSLTELGNNLTVFLGQMDEATGATTFFANVLHIVATNLNNVAFVAGAALIAFNARGLINQFRTVQVTVDGVTRSQTGAAASAGLWVREQARLTAALSSGNAVLLGSKTAAQQKSAFVVAGLRAEADAQRHAIATSQQATVQYQAQFAQLERQIIAQRAALGTARTLDAASRARGSGPRSDLVLAATKELNASLATRARLQALVAREDDVLAAADAKLAAATGRLTQEEAALAAMTTRLSASRMELLLATGAATAAESRLTVAQRALAVAEAEVVLATEALVAAKAELSIVSATAAAGEGALAVAMEAVIAAEAQLFVATQGVTGAEAELAVASTAAAAAETRLAVATAAAVPPMRILTLVTTGLAAAMAGVQRAGAAFSSFLGGPFGIALTVATVGLLYFATRADEAKDAINRLGGEAGALARAMDGVAASTANASAELARLQVLRAQDRVADALDSLQTVRGSAAQSIMGEVMRNQGIFGSGMSIDRAVNGDVTGGPVFQGPEAEALRRVERLTNLIREGRINAAGTYAELHRISQLAPTIISPQFVRQAARDQSGQEGPIELVAQGEEGFNRINRSAAERLAAAQAPPPVIPRARTRAQMEAAAAAQAAQSDLERARANLAQIRAEGKRADESEQQYIDRLADARRAVSSLMSAERARRSANAAARREARAVETASDKQDRLDNVMERFDLDTPIRRLARLQAQADAAKRSIDDLVGERVGNRVFTQAEADERKGQIDDFVASESRRPVREALEDMRAQEVVQRQLLAGHQAMSEFTARRLELEKQVGPLTAQEARDLADQQASSRALARSQQERNRLIEVYAGLMGTARDSARDIIRAFASSNPLRNIGTALSRLRSRFLDAKAEEIAIQIFGDPEQEWRDQMTGAMEQVATNLTNSATDLGTAATALDNAANALQGAAGAGGGGGVGGPYEPIPGDPDYRPSEAPAFWPAPSNIPSGNPLDPNMGSPSGIDWAALDRSLAVIAEGERGGSVIETPGIDRAADVLGDVAGQLEGVAGAMTQAADGSAEVVVTATRDAKKGLPRNVTEAMNQIGEKLAAKIFGANSPFTKIFGQLGTFLEGTAYGQIGGGLARSLGAKTSNLGSQIGGGVGAVAATAVGLPPQLGGLIGGVIGGLIGGVFKKSKTGSATITSASGDYTLAGNSAAYRGQAGEAAGSVQGGLVRIAEALGGSLGAFAVSIGLKDGKYRVDPTGKGNVKTKKGAIDFGDDQEAAIRYAILDALKDGAIQGIREGSKRLLQAGKDLDRALDRALNFENVFRRLKTFKDPAGAAVDDVNREFVNLIDIFKEAGASAQEWADLEELYGFERAEAIKNATNQSISALNDFIQGITAGPDSPLGRRTVYDNADKALDTFRTDIAAGKTVDTDALIAALENFQAASQTLYGSRSPFFQDFDEILALAEAARTNAGGAITGDNPNLPASPFDDALRATWPALLTESQSQTQILGDIRDLLGGGTPSTGGGGGGGGDGSSIGILPGPSTTYDPWQGWGGGGYQGQSYD